MKKIALAHDMSISGWGKISEGTTFKVVRFNQRYVYVVVAEGIELRLARKRDCIVIY